MSEVLADSQVLPRCVPLRDAVQVNPKIDRTALTDETEVSFVPMAAVGAASGHIDVSTVRPYAEVKKGYTNFRNGDVLFAKVTPCMENGKMAVARQLKNGVGFGSTEFHVLRPREGVDSQYIYYFVSSQTFRKEAAGHMTGAVGLRRVPSAFLESAEIPLPPLERQREIVAELEKQFSRLDEAVANLQRVKANLKRYKASVLKAAVEGRLVETEATLARREGRIYETGERLLQRTIDARNSRAKARRAKAEPAALPSANDKEIPDGWVWTTTGQVCECIVPNRDKPKTFSGDIPWLTLPDFDDSEIAIGRSKSGLGFTESEVSLYRAKVIPTESVVMSCVGRFGISAVITRKAVINQQLHAFLPSEGVTPKYLAYVLRTREQEMLEKSTATTIAYLNKENCNSVSVPLPPLAEQTRIVAEVDRHLPIVREVEAEVDTNLKRAQALRQATLAKAFSGE